jgi:hypothetical protein
LAVRELRESSGNAMLRSEQRTWHVTVAHVAGERPVRDQLVQFLIDGRIEQTQRIDLSAGESRELTWGARLGPGRHRLEVRLGSDDQLPLDNRVRLIVDVQSKQAIVLIGNAVADTQYVELALQAGEQTGMRLQRTVLGAIERLEPGDRDVWVLCNPGRLSKSALRHIDQHRLQGGGVVWWLGPAWQSNPGSANTGSISTGAADELAKVSGARVLGVRDFSLGTIDPLDYQSPLVAPFEAYPGAGLLTLPVFRCWEVELTRGWQTAVAIRDNEAPGQGFPLIATFDPVLSDLVATDSAGWGRQVLITTPPGVDEPWNAMIAWPAFVPLVQEIVGWVSRSDGQVDPYRTGEMLRGQMLQGQKSEVDWQAELVTEDGQRLAAEVLRRVDEVVQWRAGPARFVGFYQWGGEMTAADPNDVVVAVNLDPAESLLAATPLVPAPWERVSFAEPLVEDSPATDQTPVRLGAETTSEISWWFIVGGLVLLFGETAVVRLLEQQN